MGPRRHGFSPSKKASQKDGSTKHTKSLKNKVRDVQRLLKKSDLPATVRVVQERMLDVLKETIKDKAKEHKEKKSLKRSMKVKFFEKRKIFRKYKACIKELNEKEDWETKSSMLRRNTLEKELEEIKQQWNYVVHFPQDTKYISLFPLTSYTNSEVRAKQEQILKTITKKVASGELEDASSTIGQMGSASKERKKKKSVLVLSDGEAEQADPNEDSGDETEEREPPPKLNLDDDFFIDTSPSTGSPSGKEDLKKKKKMKSSNKRKRSQFKIEKK